MTNGEKLDQIFPDGICPFSPNWLKSEYKQSNSDGPMQVDLEGDGMWDGKIVYDYGKCPKCGWKFEEGEKDWEQPYCCHCGQRLKWFESEDKE